MSLVTFNIEKDLVDFWYPIVNHHINHVIAPFRQDLTRVEVTLLRENIVGKKDSLFKCEVLCHSRNGYTHHNKIFNRDGDLALADSLSRLKRELTRQ